MNTEKSEVLEKYTDRDSIKDRRAKLYFHAPAAPYERRKPKIYQVDNENVTDCLTATYWG